MNPFDWSAAWQAFATAVITALTAFCRWLLRRNKPQTDSYTLLKRIARRWDLEKENGRLHKDLLLRDIEIADLKKSLAYTARIIQERAERAEWIVSLKESDTGSSAAIPAESMSSKSSET